MITLSITSAGIPWSASDLARITPDPEAPLCSVQQQLEALGYRVTAIQGSGMEVSAEVEVTGESITDEQIRELQALAFREVSGRRDNHELYRYAALALQPPHNLTNEARSYCAAAINARAMAQAALEHNLRGGGE